MDIVILDHAKGSMTHAVAEHATQVAVSVLSLLHLKPELYKAAVDRDDGVYYVDFVEKDARLGVVLGNPGRIPGIEVKVDPKTFKVIRYGLIR